jgi:hypothetical protein
MVSYAKSWDLLVTIRPQLTLKQARRLFNSLHHDRRRMRQLDLCEGRMIRMGLDMYAYAIDEKPATEVDFTPPERNEAFEAWAESGYDEAKAPYLHYWRKHPDLHGWMEQLYREKGGKDPDFNGNTLVLTPEDLTRLEQALLIHDLPHTEGFFFGASAREDLEGDLEFLEKACAAIAQGKTVYYDSSW